jgi:hypothetical protein
LPNADWMLIASAAVAIQIAQLQPNTTAKNSHGLDSVAEDAVEVLSVIGCVANGLHCIAHGMD